MTAPSRHAHADDAVILADLAYLDRATGAPGLLRVGTEAYDDPTAPGRYAGWILATPALTRAMAEDHASWGVGRDDAGALTVTLAHGAAWMRDAIWNGRAIVLRRVPRGGGWSTATVIFSGVLGVAQPARDRIVLPIHDAFAAALDAPIGVGCLTGATADGQGWEGEPSQADARPPVLIGRVARAAGTSVNRARRIQVLGDTTAWGFTVTAVDDRGEPLTVDAASATVQAMHDAVAPPGHVLWAAEAGQRAMGRLVSAPAGAVAWAVATHATAADRCAARLIADILADRCGLTVAAADVTAAAAAAPAECGVQVAGETARRRVVDLLAASGGLALWRDRDGTVRMARRAVPTAAAATWRATAKGAAQDGRTGDHLLVRLEPRHVSREAGGLPCPALTLTGQANAVRLSESDVVGLAGLDADLLARLTRAHATRTAEDAAVAARHALAVDRTLATAIVEDADLAAEAAARGALLAADWVWGTATVAPHRDAWAAPALGTVGLLTDGEAGLADWPCQVVRESLDLAAGTRALLVRGVRP
ncbi:hypothetical protein [Roseospira goensis]|uniref:Uncharacterized protein n=1 Tax=Roseospira goensis TaxID=391922 RepID=A0A7W6S307_9PROT|nr:hypothetical protein [Roseospira goensis]MBB4287827.1 hypothetical protein [Roseospira goensis]